eukprot:4509105-Lingulodinium_polyedra.AAC.1
MEVELTSHGKGKEPTRKDPRLLVVILWALERFVADESQAPFWRMYAWRKLVQSWVVVRFDDHRGVATGT